MQETTERGMKYFGAGLDRTCINDIIHSWHWLNNGPRPNFWETHKSAYSSLGEKTWYHTMVAQRIVSLLRRSFPEQEPTDWKVRNVTHSPEWPMAAWSRVNFHTPPTSQTSLMWRLSRQASWGGQINRRKTEPTDNLPHIHKHTLKQHQWITAMHRSCVFNKLLPACFGFFSTYWILH